MRTAFKLLAYGAALFTFAFLFSAFQDAMKELADEEEKEKEKKRAVREESIAVSNADVDAVFTELQKVVDKGYPKHVPINRKQPFTHATADHALKVTTLNDWVVKSLEELSDVKAAKDQVIHKVVSVVIPRVKASGKARLGDNLECWNTVDNPQLRQLLETVFSICVRRDWDYTLIVPDLEMCFQAIMA
mmetsp:Transcript_70050/g.123814  ORF Transcript_70050/g.123814 Transcript_70050/m.123814 type:complete len:189 (-) Transcript_70050:8-574(-)